MSRRLVAAWMKKYMFDVKSPSVSVSGYDYEYDYLVAAERESECNGDD